MFVTMIRNIALNGLPGAGKTALSVALSYDQDIRQHFPDGILWAGLGPTPQIAVHLKRWGKLLMLSAETIARLKEPRDWMFALYEHIGQRSFLIVLDDTWQARDAFDLRIGGPNCAHIMTTRFPTLSMAFSFEDALTVEELNEDDSLTLLTLLAPHVMDTQEERIVELLPAFGGLPLALTLMGNYLRIQAYSQQPRRIQAAIERLSNASERLKMSESHMLSQEHTSLKENTPLSLESVIAVTDQQLSQSAPPACLGDRPRSTGHSSSCLWCRTYTAIPPLSRCESEHHQSLAVGVSSTHKRKGALALP